MWTNFAISILATSLTFRMLRLKIGTRYRIHCIQQSRSKSQNGTFRRLRFSCHLQQYKQSSIKLITVLLTQLMMTAESKSSKRPVLRFASALLFPLNSRIVLTNATETSINVLSFVPMMEHTLTTFKRSFVIGKSITKTTNLQHLNSTKIVRVSTIIKLKIKSSL